jgi:hypothetical protein
MNGGGCHQIGFGRNRSTADQVFCTRQKLKQRMTVYSVNKPLADLGRTHDSVLLEGLYDSHIELDVSK